MVADVVIFESVLFFQRIGGNLQSGKLTDVWCVIYNKDAPTYRDKWDTIREALA